MRTSSAHLSQGFLEDGQSSAKKCQIHSQKYYLSKKKIFFVLTIAFVFAFVFVMIGNVRAMVMAVEQRFLRSWDKKVSSVG